jgi:hypothetical protein
MYLRYYWALFVGELMNNSFAASPSPNCVKMDAIEDVRLGTILINAMKSRYESADEIIADIKLVALTAGVRIIDEDEVAIDEEWEHVFEARGTELHLRAQ